MRYRYLPLPLVALALGVGLAQRPDAAHACAVAPMRGKSVSIADETALIVWDSKTKTEHFIRTASFSSTSAEFGFLVPTPTPPELGEVSPNVFGALSEATKPKVEYRTETRKKSSGGCLGATANSTFATVGADLAPNAAPKSNVQVLGKKRVGEFDAAILKATDGPALRKWLLDNGYDARPELEAWLDVYTKLNWIITAFKIAADQPGAGPNTTVTVRSTAVRMSFPAERPFYPYREPVAEEAPGAPRYPRLLRVFLVADARYDGTVGDNAANVWPGQTAYSKPFEPAQSVFANLNLPAKAAAEMSGQTWRLTEFEDRSTPRRGTDEVYFHRSANQADVERPPQIVVNTVYVEDNSANWVFGFICLGTTLVLVVGGFAILLGVIRLLRR